MNPRDQDADRDRRQLIDALPATKAGRPMPAGATYELRLSQRAVDLLYTALTNEGSEQRSGRDEARQGRFTNRLRWYRPSGGSDNDVVLQQAFKWTWGDEPEWVPVPTVMED